VFKSQTQLDQLTDKSELVLQCFVLSLEGRLLHLFDHVLVKFIGGCLLVDHSPLLFQTLGHPMQRHLNLIVYTMQERMQ
jgi:hypothetical protein